MTCWLEGLECFLSPSANASRVLNSAVCSYDCDGYDANGFDKHDLDVSGHHRLHTAAKNGDVTTLKTLLAQVRLLLWLLRACVMRRSNCTSTLFWLC